MKQKVLFNILTRSSERPFGFNMCYNSIKSQTYKNVIHYVSTDNPLDFDYLEGKDIVVVKVNKQADSNVKFNADGDKYAPYNLYCNELLKRVQHGWILFLDDDDNLLHNKVLEELVEYINCHDEDTLFIWQMRYPNGKLAPSNELIKKEIIKINNIGSPCFAFNAKYKNLVKWDNYKRSDFRFINELKDHIPKKVFLKKVYVQVNNFGDFGNRNDIGYSAKKSLPFSFYKNLLWYFLPKFHYKLLGVLIFHKNTYIRLFKKVKRKLKVNANG